MRALVTSYLGLCFLIADGDADRHCIQPWLPNGGYVGAEQGAGAQPPLRHRDRRGWGRIRGRIRGWGRVYD